MFKALIAAVLLLVLVDFAIDHGTNTKRAWAGISGLFRHAGEAGEDSVFVK